MRYFTYEEFSFDEPHRRVTVSEEEIRKEYWPYWYGKMCEKYGKEVVDAEYSWEDCLDDWVIVHWARRSTE